MGFLRRRIFRGKKPIKIFRKGLSRVRRISSPSCSTLHLRNRHQKMTICSKDSLFSPSQMNSISTDLFLFPFYESYQNYIIKWLNYNNTLRFFSVFKNVENQGRKDTFVEFYPWTHIFFCISCYVIVKIM